MDILNNDILSITVWLNGGFAYVCNAKDFKHDIIA